MSPFIKDERVRHIKALVRSGVASSGAIEIIDGTIGFLGNSSLSSKSFGIRVPPRRERIRLKPHGDCLIAGYLKRGGVSEAYIVIHAIEGEGLTELACCEGRASDKGSVVSSRRVVSIAV